MSEPSDFDGRFDRTAIEALLKRLETLARETNPAGGDDSAQGKDRKAFLALMRAGDLMRLVAGWAIDHVCGLSLQDGEGKETGKMLSLQPTQIYETPHYQSHRVAADSHLCEKVGTEITEHIAALDLTSVQKQKILRNLLFSGAHGFPGWLRSEMIDAIEALQVGDTRSLFSPPPESKGRKRDYPALRAQLTAVGIVRFWHKVMKDKEKALQKVAAHFAISTDTLKSWEQRVSDDFGPIELARTRAFAENCASFVLHAQELKLKGIPFDPVERDAYAEAQKLSEFHLDAYGDDAIKKAAEAYWAGS